MRNSKPLSYPGSKCILEHMEANKRYYLASRCPKLQTMHRKTPLKIHSFKISGQSVQVNELDHSFDCKLIQSFDGEFASVTNYCIKSKHAYREVNIGDIDRREAFKLFLNQFFIQNHTFVGRLEIGPYYCDVQFPVGMNLRVRELQLARHGYKFLEKTLPVISPSSFPLKKLVLVMPHPNSPMFQNSILQNAESLEIHPGEQNLWKNTILALENKVIKFSHVEIDHNDILPLIVNWLKHPQDVGRKFSFVSFASDKFFWPFITIQIGRGLDPLNENSGLVQPEQRYLNHSKCHTYLLLNETELNIYYRKMEKEEHNFKYRSLYEISIEVMKAGSSKATEEE